MSNIKVIEKLGGKPGKTTLILAGVHGNETCGVRAFDEILPNLNIESGKVIFIYSNLEAISQNKRCIEKNLNRCFFKNQPEDIYNSLEGKTAREIMSYLEQADLMLDIHQSFTADSLPFVIIDEKNIAIGKIFDSEIVSFNWDTFEPGSTDYFMNLQKKIGICFECGAFQDLSTKERAKKAIFNFLIYTGNLDGNLEERKEQRILKIKSIYKNYISPFTRVKYLPDFWKAKEKVILGKEGKRDVFIEKEDIVLFLSNSKELNEECFLLAEEIYLNKQNTTNLRELKW